MRQKPPTSTPPLTRRTRLPLLSREHSSKKPVVIVFGSGPIRIGQGIEFDYASVHCVWALKNAGYEVVIVNNNPETVSTDFNTADRLYFEPLTPEDVGDVIRVENPVGAVVAFGGQTAIRLTKWLSENNVPILGTPADSIDAAEDRGRFEALLKQLHIKQPVGDTVHTAEEAIVNSEPSRLSGSAAPHLCPWRPDDCHAALFRMRIS